MDNRPNNEKKVAILITGNYRTFDKTYYLIRKNLIDCNNAKIFIYCETEIESSELLRRVKLYLGDDCIGDDIYGLFDFIFFKIFIYLDNEKWFFTFF